jgi:hypothetical protein
MLQVAGAEVSVRQSADPSAVKVGEAALAGTCCGEVDTCVVQVEASLILVRNCLHGFSFAVLIPCDVDLGAVRSSLSKLRGCAWAAISHGLVLRDLQWCPDDALPKREEVGHA